MVCGVCGYDEQKSQEMCSVCGTALTIPTARQTLIDKLTALTETGVLQPDLYLTLHISEVSLRMPFPAGAELMVGRGGDNKTSTIVNPVLNIYPRQNGELQLYDEPIAFLNLAPYSAEKSGVSRKHVRIYRDGQGIVIEDQGSTNGTRVNNDRLQSGQRRAIRSGDIITVGLLSLKITYSSEKTPSKPRQKRDKLSTNSGQ